MSNIDIIKETYYNPLTGFIGIEKLYKRLKKKGYDITRDTIEDFLNKQYTNQVNKTIRKPKEYSSIVAQGKRHNYQMDIIVYDRYAFNHYKYILCVIDVYSRYASVRAMTNRNNSTIMKNVKDIFEEMGKPKNINCDNEFNTREFNKYVVDNDIRVYYSQPNEINKNAIIERFNRTLIEIIQKWRTATGKYDWYKVLDKIVNNYNNSYHRTIKATPNDIWNGKDYNKQVIKKVETKFKVGDKVRIIKHKAIFDKVDSLSYSKSIYIIIEIKGAKHYLINIETGKEIEQYYKSYELKSVNDIQYKPESNEEEQIYIKEQKEKKQNRQIKKSGIEKYDGVDLGKRIRKIKRDDDYEYN